MSELLTPSQVAQRFPGLTEGYLQKLRVSGCGPAYSKPTGRRVLYAVADIENWLSASRRTSTSEGC